MRWSLERVYLFTALNMENGTCIYNSYDWRVYFVASSEKLVSTICDLITYIFVNKNASYAWQIYIFPYIIILR